MKELIIAKKPTRFFESLGVLILSHMVIDQVLGVGAGTTELALAGLYGSTGVLLVLGLWVVRVRMASWFLLLVAGVVLIIVDPANPSGILCCLIAANLLALSGWFLPKPFWKSVALLLLVVAGQVVALLAHPGEFVRVLTVFVIADLLLGYLASAYSDQFAQPRRPRRPVLDLKLDDLSPRENEIIRMVADDMTSKEISLELGISSGTVRNALSIIYKKLGVSDGKALYFYLQRLLETSTPPENLTAVLPPK